MPNWVYSGIKISTPLTKKQKQILKNITKEKSICQYYVPRAKEIAETRSPENIVSQKEYDEIQIKNKEKVENHKEGEHLFLDRSITQEMNDNLIKKYGTNNWYDWSCMNWGTKWGDCDLEIDIEGGDIRFDSAWSPISPVIIEMFAKDFPTFHYHFEEEQGWGGEFDFEDGECVHSYEYDYPNFADPVEYKDVSLCELREEHPRYSDGAGFYGDWNEFMGRTLEEAKEYVDAL
jgi:hypothetical protein